MPPPPPGAVPPPLAPQHQYYVAMHGQTYGPYPYEYMLEMLKSNQINTQTSVWRDGLPNWIPVAQCPELNTQTSSIVPPPPPPPPFA